MTQTSHSALTFVKQWLLHALIGWLALNVIDVINFLMKAEAGMTLILPDGSVFTVWDRIVSNIARPIWLPILLGTLIIEINYRFVFQRKKLVIFIGASLFGACICTLLLWTPNLWEGNAFWGERTTWMIISGLLPVFGLLFLYSILYTLIRNYIHTRIQTAEKQLHHSQAELSALKAQINPHFFFNTLNNIYGTALEENATRTAQFIERLSGMMRYVITGSQSNFINLSEEIKFVDEYLELQRIRIPDQTNIRIKQHVDYDGQPAQVTPLLLIPFIENAFQYGISIDRECDINFSLIVKNRRLKMVIINRLIHGQAQRGHGTGIRNASKQLELIYPNRHQLKISRTESEFIVDLDIELHDTMQP